MFVAQRYPRPVLGASRPQVIYHGHRNQHWPAGLTYWNPLFGPRGNSEYDYVGHAVASYSAGALANTTTAHYPQFGAVVEVNGIGGASTVTGNALAFSNSQATLAWWCKLRNATPSDTAKTAFPVIIDCDFVLTSHYPYTDGLVYTSHFLANRGSFTPLASVNRTEWHHVCITTKPGAGNWNFYQNGLLAASATGPDPIPTIWRAGLFGYDTTYGFDGWITDYRVYNRWMSDNEVYALWNPKTRWDLYRVPGLPYADNWDSLIPPVLSPEFPKPILR